MTKSILKHLTILSFLFIGAKSFATVDGMTESWIVVKKLDEDTFYPQRVPVIGCYGLAQGPHLNQFTSEFLVKSTRGCGDADTSMTNINELSCATEISSEESDDYMSFKKITLDISKCPYKNNANFITMVRTAAARNFPQSRNGKYVKSPEVELVLIK